MKKFPLSIICIFIISILFISCNNDINTPGLTQDAGLTDSTGLSLNSAPTGSAGIGKTILIGETITFTGTVEDTDVSDTLTLSWTMTAKPSGSTAVIIGADTTAPSFTPDLPGDYSAELTVSDGTDTVSFSASIKVVGFAMVFQSFIDKTVTPVFFHNSRAANILEVPENEQKGCKISRLRLKNGEVYTAGEIDYDLMVWTGTSYTVIANPPEAESSSVKDMAINKNGNIELHIDSYDDASYYWDGATYYDQTDVISGSALGENYFITDIFQNGDDIYQFGTTFDENEESTYFMAKNLDEVIHSTSYKYDPYNTYNFMHEGTLFIPGSSDADCKVAYYGTREDAPEEFYDSQELNKFSEPIETDEPVESEDYFIYASYIINNGEDFVDLTENATNGEDGYETVIFMSSLNDYILRTEDYNYSGDDYGYYSVYVDGALCTMEEPGSEASEGTISNLTYDYMEIINGSIFIAGQYDYYIEEEDDEYPVFVIWRDGNIVFTAHDDNTYYNSYIYSTTIDFE